MMSKWNATERTSVVGSGSGGIDVMPQVSPLVEGDAGEEHTASHLAKLASERFGRIDFVVPAAGGAARQLTFAGSNEDPTWSPDAGYIAFSGRRSGQKKIYMTDLQGRWERQLTDGPGNDSSPSWSRRLN